MFRLFQKKAIKLLKVNTFIFLLLKKKSFYFATHQPLCFLNIICKHFFREFLLIFLIISWIPITFVTDRRLDFNRLYFNLIRDLIIISGPISSNTTAHILLILQFHLPHLLPAFKFNPQFLKLHSLSLSSRPTMLKLHRSLKGRI